MQSIISLINSLKADYPQFNFKKAKNFSWSHGDQTIYYNDSCDDCATYLLHELSHALLDHAEYKYDIELVTMERKAWDEVLAIANKYKISIDDDFIQSTLDTYRDWLHSRSTCPNCKATGIQTGNKSYSCIACNHDWRVNEAKVCALRRYAINKKTRI